MEHQIINRNKGRGCWFRMICLGLGLISLSGCSVHKASFDCPNGKGMGCGSMLSVHEAIKDNNFPRESDNLGQINNKIKQKSALSSTSPANMQVATQTFDNNNLVYRSQDKIMRIWFNSYFDEHNNFHDSQYIYTIIQPAQWLINR